MNKPLTTAEAKQHHTCGDCREFQAALDRLRRFLFACGAGQSEQLLADLETTAHRHCDCVEGATCSRSCPSCKQRTWFAGDHDMPDSYACPYCGGKVDNDGFARNHNQMLRLFNV